MHIRKTNQKAHGICSRIARFITKCKATSTIDSAIRSPVLGSVVLVLILTDQATSREVVGLAFATAPVLDLEPLKVGLILDNFHESHGDSFGYGANGTKGSLRALL